MITSTDPLLALAERVERGEATTGLHEAILTAFGWRVQPHGWWANPAGKMATPPRYLSSLDAIASLQEAVLPGWRMSCASRLGGGSEHVLLRKAGERPVSSLARTLRQAWLAALLRAVATERRTLQGDQT